MNGHWRSVHTLKDGTRPWYALSPADGSNPYYGNGSTGRRAVAQARASTYRAASRGVFLLSVLNSGYQAMEGNVSGAKALLDVGFSAIGTFGGPIGLGVGAAYFVGDTIWVIRQEGRNAATRAYLQEIWMLPPAGSAFDPMVRTPPDPPVLSITAPR